MINSKTISILERSHIIEMPGKYNYANKSGIIPTYINGRDTFFEKLSRNKNFLTVFIANAMIIWFEYFVAWVANAPFIKKGTNWLLLEVIGSIMLFLLLMLQVWQYALILF